MFTEDGCLSAYDDYPASEISEHIVLFTEVGIENFQQILRNFRGVANRHRSPPHNETVRSRGAAAGQMVTLKTTSLGSDQISQLQTYPAIGCTQQPHNTQGAGTDGIHSQFAPLSASISSTPALLNCWRILSAVA